MAISKWSDSFQSTQDVIKCVFDDSSVTKLFYDVTEKQLMVAVECGWIQSGCTYSWLYYPFRIEGATALDSVPQLDYWWS